MGFGASFLGSLCDAVGCQGITSPIKGLSEQGNEEANGLSVSLVKRLRDVGVELVTSTETEPGVSTVV